MRLNTALKAAVVAAFAIAAALIAVVKSLDLEQARVLLATRVSAATGHRLTIAGPLELKLGLVPTLAASHLTLAGAPGGPRTPLATADRVVARLALLPLLAGEVVIKRLEVDSPDIRLESAADGRANWRAAPAAAPAASGGAAMVPRFDIRTIIVHDAHLAWRDHATGRDLNLTVASATVRPDRVNGGLALHLDGTFRGQPIAVEGLTGPLADALANRPWLLHLKASVAEAVLMADGRIARPAGLAGLDLALTAQGSDLAALLHLAGWEAPLPLGPFRITAHLADAGGLPGLDGIDAAVGRREALLVTAKGRVADLAHAAGLDLALAAESDGPAPQAAGGPLRLIAHLTGGTGSWHLADLRGKLGDSDLGGDLRIVAGHRPKLSGRLTASQLAWTGRAGKAGAPAAPAADGRLFSATPLPLGGLRDADADLDLAAGQVLADGADLDDVTARLRLDDGRLSLAPIAARLAGGQLTARLDLDAAAPVPALTARLDGERIDLGTLLRQMAVSQALNGGATRIALDLRGRGDSPRALAASLNGIATVAVGPGRLHSAAVDWAGGDLPSQLLGRLSPLAKGGSDAALSCAALRLTLRDGVATSTRGLAMETRRTAVVGSGTIDLRRETLDLAFAPRARGGLGLSLGGGMAGLTRLGGTLTHPVLTLDGAGAARTAASVGAAVASGGLSLLGELLYDRATADPHPCRTALAGHGHRRRGHGPGRLFGR